jgi:RNA recognition motif-containing protein
LSRLYVGNLAHETTEDQLRKAFAEYGEVSSVKVMSDRRGRQKGFAYVQMADSESADRAMESLKGRRSTAGRWTSWRTRRARRVHGETAEMRSQ